MEFYCRLKYPRKVCFRSSTKSFLYSLYNLQNVPIGFLYRQIYVVYKFQNVHDQIYIDNFGQVNAEYFQSFDQKVIATGAIVSPNASLSRLFYFTTNFVQYIYLRPPTLLGFLPYSLPVNPVNFFTVLRLYRYTLEPNIVDFAFPMIKAKFIETRFPMSIQFNYFDWIAKETPTRGGPLGPGHDQYATYFDFPNEQTSPYFNAESIYLNDICGVNYLSLSWGNPTDPKLMSSLPYGYTDTFSEIIYSISNQNPVPSPFLYPNPTSGCYTDVPTNLPAIQYSKNAAFSITANVNVYRLDKQSSAFIEGDQYKPNECLFTYLFAILTETIPTSITDCPNFVIKKRYGIIQYPVPSSVYATGQYYPENIDLQYWSVSSHLCNIGQVPSYVPFWTVNAKMIADISKDGYGYILWAPYDEVVSYIKDPKSPIPPIIHLPKNQKAYLLQEPSLAFIFRYREPSVTWSGNPIYAPCTNTPKEMFENPITNQLISPDGINWCPQIYGCDACTSLEQFMETFNSRL